MGWFQHPERGTLEDLADALHRFDDEAVTALADARTHCAQCCGCGRQLQQLRAAREAVQCSDTVAASHQLTSRITEALQAPATHAAPLPALGERRSWGDTVHGPSVLVACSVTLVMSAVAVFVWQTTLSGGNGSVAGDVVTALELDPTPAGSQPVPVAADPSSQVAGVASSSVTPTASATSPAVVRATATATVFTATPHLHTHQSTVNTVDSTPVAAAALSLCLEALGLTEDSVRAVHETTWLGDPAFSFYAHPPHGHTEQRYVVDRQCSQDDVLVRLKTDATSVTPGGK